MRNFLRLSLAALLMVLPIGCKTVTATPTPGVTQFYSQAALIMNDSSTILVQAQNMAVAIHGQALMSDTDYKTAQAVILQVATEAKAVDALIKSGGDQATIKNQINAMIAQVGQMPSSFHITNANSQQAFASLVNTLVATLQAAETLIG